VVWLAQRAVANGHMQWACLMLTEFKIGVEVSVLWSINHATANVLIADATLQAVLGCRPAPRAGCHLRAAHPRSRIVLERR
jgi:hypothetical protein